MMEQIPTSTSTQAGAAHARVHGTRRKQVLELLGRQPLTLWETARALGVADHQISGVFTALGRDGYIEHAGERRRKPETGCDAEVWRLRQDLPASPDRLADQGYPLTLRIGADLYDRQELLPAEGYPGIPYARRADAGGTRLVVRVALVECPSCCRPLFLVDPSAPQKVYHCNAPDCGRQFRPQLVVEPGKAAVLALVMEKH